MIRLQRPAQPPELLRTRGKNQRRGHSTSYSRNPAAYDSGERRFDFDSGIYGNPNVKQALIAMQHGKCAFCEAKVTHVAYGDVEHFRPKAGVRQRLGDPLSRPGYYWLAYEWSNLLFSCQLCNQRHKGNLFPLVDPSLRAKNHRAALSREQPLFIQPADEDPEVYLGFRSEVIHGKDATGRGEATWRALGLNRVELLERRRDALGEIRLMIDIVNLSVGQPDNAELHDLAEQAKRWIEGVTEDDAEYAAMARAAVSAVASG